MNIWIGTARRPCFFFFWREPLKSRTTTAHAARRSARRRRPINRSHRHAPSPCTSHCRRRCGYRCCPEAPFGFAARHSRLSPVGSAHMSMHHVAERAALGNVPWTCVGCGVAHRRCVAPARCRRCCAQTPSALSSSTRVGILVMAH